MVRVFHFSFMHLCLVWYVTVSPIYSLIHPFILVPIPHNISFINRSCRLKRARPSRTKLARSRCLPWRSLTAQTLLKEQRSRTPGVLLVLSAMAYIPTSPSLSTVALAWWGFIYIYNRSLIYMRLS